MNKQEKFFRALGRRLKELRDERNYNQEDMIYFGFAVRHWQRIEAGKNITVATLLKICEAFHMPMEQIVRGLDKDFYKSQPRIVVPPRRKSRT